MRIAIKHVKLTTLGDTDKINKTIPSSFACRNINSFFMLTD